MGRHLGKKQGATSPKMEKAQAENLALGRRVPILRFNGALTTIEKVKDALRLRLPDYLDRIAELAESDDPRVALDAAKYLTDRTMGKPTEKVQTEQLPVTYQAPSDTQFRELAGRIQGKGPNGEGGVDPDGDGVSHTPDATEAV